MSKQEIYANFSEQKLATLQEHDTIKSFPVRKLLIRLRGTDYDEFPEYLRKKIDAEVVDVKVSVNHPNESRVVVDFRDILVKQYKIDDEILEIAFPKNPQDTNYKVSIPYEMLLHTTFIEKGQAKVEATFEYIASLLRSRS